MLLCFVYNGIEPNFICHNTSNKLCSMCATVASAHLKWRCCCVVQRRKKRGGNSKKIENFFNLIRFKCFYRKCVRASLFAILNASKNICLPFLLSRNDSLSAFVLSLCTVETKPKHEKEVEKKSKSMKTLQKTFPPLHSLAAIKTVISMCEIELHRLIDKLKI